MKNEKREFKPLMLAVYFLLIIFLTIMLVSANQINKKDFVKYNPRVLDVFENQSYAKKLINQADFIGLQIIDDKVWAKVLVNIKDNSGIEYSGTKEERLEQSKQRDKWFEPIIQEALDGITKTEIKNINKGFSGFGALVTKKAFEELISDDRIEKVIWSQYGPKPFLKESMPIINADDAWGSGYTGDGVKVCVIDSGVDSSNSYVYGNVVDEKCYCSDNCCPNNQDEDDSAEDGSGHGTAVISVIVSNDENYTGIAYDSNIYVVRIADDEGELSQDWQDVRNAIDWCRNQGAEVIGMSFGYGHYNSQNCIDDVDTEINNAYNVGIVLTSASGNEGHDDGVSYPACSQNVISVGMTYDGNFGEREYCWNPWWLPCWEWLGTGCTDENSQVDDIVCMGNIGSNLDLLAPGCIIGTLTSEGALYDDCGTSLSAPMVSGAAALLLEKNSSLEPDEIKYILQSTGVSVEDWKRIDVEAALNSICICDDWTAGFCGGGTCNANERQYTRTCDPSACAIETKCEYDASCDEGPPPGVSYCKYDDGGEEDCPSGYSATGHDCYQNGNYWECELECWKDEYCGDYGSWSYPYNQFEVGVGDDYPNIYAGGHITTSSSYCYQYYGKTFMSVTDFDPGGILHLDTESYELTAQYGWNGSSGGTVDDCSDTQQSNFDVTSSTKDYGRGDGKQIYARGWFIPYQDEYCGGNEAYGLEGDLTLMNFYRTATYYPEDYDYLYCDVPYTKTITIDSTIYGDADADCYVDVEGSESNPDEIKVKWYVNGDFKSSEYKDCNEGIDCDKTFTLSNSYFSKGDQVYCIARGYGEDGGHGAYDSSSTTTVSNRVSTWSSINLDKSYAKQGDNIKVTASGEADLDSDVLAMYCCKGDSCTPTTSNHDFCYVTGDSSPYDLYCAGQAIREEGTKTVRCRIYDGDDYSTIQSDTYEAYIDDAPNVTLISPPNNSTNKDGIVTFNCSATDDSNLVNITLYGNWSGGWHANETKSLTGTSDSATFTKSLSDGIYEWNCLAYDNASQGGIADVNWIVNVSIPPNDTHKFSHKNSSGSIVAWFGNLGNIVLKGNCYSGGSCDNPGPNSFIFRNSTNANVAYINSTGDMCIVTGDCSDQSATCNPTRDAFIMRNSSNYNMSYIDFDGDLCLTGKLYENSEL